MLTLKLGLTKNPRFEPLIGDTVKSAQCNLDIVVTTPPELFYRNLKNDEFDVFEMSLSEYLITRERAQGERWPPPPGKVVPLPRTSPRGPLARGSIGFADDTIGATRAISIGGTA